MGEKFGVPNEDILRDSNKLIDFVVQTERKISEKAKSLGSINPEGWLKEWGGHPGNLDFMAEKDGKLSFFEVKVNQSQLNKWQKLRLLWLSKNNIPAKVIRVKISFTPLDLRDNKNILIKIPFKKIFTFGLIKEKSEFFAGDYFIPKAGVTLVDYYRDKNISIGQKEKVYLIDLVGEQHIISSAYPESLCEKLNYAIEFEDIEDIKDGKLMIPTEKEIEETAKKVKSYYHQEYGYDYEDMWAMKWFNRKKRREASENEIIQEKTGENCPKCGAQLLIKFGKFRKSCVCSKFPKCKYTAPF